MLFPKRFIHKIINRVLQINTSQKTAIVSAIDQRLGTNFLHQRQRSFCSLRKIIFAAMATSVIKVYDDDKIVKSNADKRKYRGLELANGLKLLLVSDPDTDKSSVAMDVRIGHLKDPHQFPGLAHFCEHMLFLGTEKYPSENEYNKFLSEHGGMSNAFTSMENTNFYFDVAPDHLAEAVDRFAQFFISPLFTESATGREVNAVDSENSRNLQSDLWRMHQLEKSLASPNHDFSKFGTGNKETLETLPKSQGADTREALLKFHAEHYSSNIMCCCAIGREDLDTLQQMLVPLFEGVVNKNVTVATWEDPPYTQAELKKVVQAVPVKDIREMSVIWPSPDLNDKYKENPCHYLGHLIGHEGKGSLLSELKAKGWVNSLVGGHRSGAKGFAFFSVSVDLTEEGFKHTDEIITMIFQYVNMLKEQGPQEWVYQECKELSALSFHFKDKETPRSYSSALASKMQDYPLEDVLSAYALFDRFSPELINVILDKLVPENMRIGIIGKNFEGQTDQVEKWYGTHYKVTDFTEEQIKAWTNCGSSDKFTLPAKNEFIPTNFELVDKEPGEELLPEMIKDTALSRLWFKQDHKFLKPKACVSVDMISPVAYLDPLHTNMNSLFVQLFNDALTEYSYMADLAGLRYSLDNSVYGCTLTVKGYNDKLATLLQRVVEKMTEFTVDPARLEIFKEMHGRNLRNFQAEQPHQHAIYYTNMLTSELVWTKDELLQALDEVTPERLQAFISELLSRVYLEGLVYGNVTRGQAMDMLAGVEATLTQHCRTRPLLASQKRTQREFQLPDGCYFLHREKNIVHESSAIEVYYQVGQQTTINNMLLELFCQVISEPCFNVLRTQEQLGYIVFSGVRRSKGVQGLRVIIQSSRSPAFVEQRIENFLKGCQVMLADMSEEEFGKHVEALASRRLEAPKKLMQQNNKYWTEIVSGFYNFDRDNLEVEFLRSLKKKDLLMFYKENLALDAPHRHKLSVHVASEVPGSEDKTEDVSCQGDAPTELAGEIKMKEPVVVSDVMEFKRDLHLYPLPKPFIDLRKAKAKL